MLVICESEYYTDIDLEQSPSLIRVAVFSVLKPTNDHSGLSWMIDILQNESHPSNLLFV